MGISDKIEIATTFIDKTMISQAGELSAREFVLMYLQILGEINI